MCDDVGSVGASDASSRARKSALSCGDARASSQSIVARVDIGGVLTIGAGGDVVTIGTVGAMLAVAVAVAVADGPVTLVTVETGSGDSHRYSQHRTNSADSYYVATCAGD